MGGVHGRGTSNMAFVTTLRKMSALIATMSSDNTLLLARYTPPKRHSTGDYWDLIRPNPYTLNRAEGGTDWWAVPGSAKNLFKKGLLRQVGEELQGNDPSTGYGNIEPGFRFYRLKSSPDPVIRVGEIEFTQEEWDNLPHGVAGLDPTVKLYLEPKFKDDPRFQIGIAKGRTGGTETGQIKLDKPSFHEVDRLTRKPLPWPNEEPLHIILVRTDNDHPTTSSTQPE